MSQVHVCLHERPSVTDVCKRCGNEFVVTRAASYCSNACRQAAYRESPAHAELLANKARQAEFRKAERQIRWNIAFASRNRNRALSFDGRYSGSGAREYRVVP